MAPEAADAGTGVRASRLPGHDADAWMARDLDIGFSYEARPVFLTVADQLEPLKLALAAGSTISQGFLKLWESRGQGGFIQSIKLTRHTSSVLVPPCTDLSYGMNTPYPSARGRTEPIWRQAPTCLFGHVREGEQPYRT